MTNISKTIARSGKPHTIGEQLLLPVIEEVLQTMVHHGSLRAVTKSIPLSNNSVQRRVDEMSEDVENILCNILKRQQFGLQLDESTLPNIEALLLGYVGFIKDSEVVQELLFAKELVTDTRGESIFAAVELFFKERGIPMENIACATYGAPASTGKYKGFHSYLKKAVPGVFTIHCVVHRQHLVARNLSSDRLSKSLDAVIKAVNKIKCKPLNYRIFKQLCHENGEEFDRLLLHTEVRWLSRGNCFKRFFSLFNTVVEFLQENKFCALSDDLIVCKSNIAYLRLI
ncbi:hypothetical protein FHG87_011661 [Trinorchestia longiramus]|nr:hypothetical protein FHG87_011661 [Trinorchestia longiramus]